jgi:monofunctional biosynthetic peptidoglycan transglycosylase
LVAGPLLFVVPLRGINPPTSAFILADASERAHVPRSWVPLEHISPELQIAVIASEDQKFPVHNGFDVSQISKAIDERLAGERSRGASTITQQVAKNLYLWSDQSFFRKGIEAYLTTWIEWTWPKRRILEIYLNVAEFGPGVFGAGAASDRFFGKPARALTAREAALLASVLPNPKRLSAQRPSPDVASRGREIEATVRALGGTRYLRKL